MKADNIITDDMTLEQKLAAIDSAMKVGAKEFNEKNGRPTDAPVDPMDALHCEGCQ